MTMKLGPDPPFPVVISGPRPNAFVPTMGLKFPAPIVNFKFPLLDGSGMARGIWPKLVVNRQKVVVPRRCLAVVWWPSTDRRQFANDGRRCSCGSVLFYWEGCVFFLFQESPARCL